MRFGKGIAAAVGLTAAATLAATWSGPAHADAALDAMAAPSVRSSIAADQFYFVMTDRYSDGNPANNSGGTSGGIDVTGFAPSDMGYYHGGDLAGLTGKCDEADLSDNGLARIKRLGFTAVWITPPFVQRTVQGDSAAYHGYWFLDLSKPDPHVGTEAEFASFMSCAKKLGLKVFLDVVVNHTADVIDYRQGNAYVSVAKRPYRMSNGKAFNPYLFARGTAFPKLSPRISFAKTPVVQEGFVGAKYPPVLNDVTKYHNRGDIDWGSCVGRCETDGDFVGLDDIMTEDWTVVQALGAAYGNWITRYGVDGFRIDTAKHVDPYFFGRWLPLIQQTASAAGKSGFTSFGEAWITDTAQLSEFQLARGLPSVLDFPYQDTVRKFVSKSATGGSLSGLFADDDLYTSPSTNAYGLTTFLGNHDMGRIGFFIATGSQSTGQSLLERDLLAHDVLYLTRGVPVVYYGDEVGMTGSGDGKDKNARQDMFPTQVSEWQGERRIGSEPIGMSSSFNETTPIEARMAALAKVRAENPALASGAQITRYGQGSVYVASRIDAAARREYVVAFNNDDAPASASFPTSTPGSQWTPLLGGTASTSDAAGGLAITIPARSTVVLKAEQALPQPPTPSVTLKVAKDAITGKYQLTANVPGSDPSTVSFVMRARGSGQWTPLGTDDARPFRVYAPTRKGAPVEVAAVVRDSSGQVASSSPISVKLKPFL